MPMYEYKCDRCGEVFELIQRFSDEPLKTHEGCGGAVERLLSAPALQFKGSGWYITDYAKPGNATTPAAKNGGTESKPAASSGDASSSSSGSSSGSKSSSSSSSTSTDTRK